MRRGEPALWILLAAVLAAAAWSAVTYNRLVRSRLAVDAQWAQVEAQYQRRVDLVPGLVAAVRGTLIQERAVIDAILRARAAYLAAPPGSDSRVQMANRLEQPLSRLLGVVESYPELRSSDTVLRLMDELAGTENRIAVERRRYNDRVRMYNTLVQQFPAALVASAAGFRLRPYFEAGPEAGTPPAVTLPSR
jgi:LemA protein